MWTVVREVTYGSYQLYSYSASQTLSLYQSAAAAELVAEYNSILISNHCRNAAAVIFIYEYFITIGEEAKYFWNRKLTGASALFFLNRYVPLIECALEFSGYASVSDQSCAWLAKFLFVYHPLPYVFWAAFAGSRAFALTNRNWTMLLLVCGLSLVPVVVNLVPAHYGVTGENIPFTGCVEDDGTPLDVAKRLVVASRASILVADSLLILITWYSLFRKGAFSLTFGTTTFAEVLLRDGTIYFVVLVVLNAMHLAFSLASFAIPALQNVSDITIFTDPVTAILVQRFLFHLQSVNHRTLGLDSSQLGDAARQSSSLVFNRVIGSLGGSIPPEDFLGTSEDDMVEDEQEGGMGCTSTESETP